jgi:adenylate cyclase
VTDPTASRVAAAIAAEEARAFEVAARVRLIALAVFAVWTFVENPAVEALFIAGFIALLAALGATHRTLRRRGRLTPWLRALFPLLDALVLAVIIIAPNPLDDTSHPIPQRYRWGNEIYFCALIGFSVFSYQPRFVLWTGIVSAFAWTLATLVVLGTPGAFTLSGAEWLALAPAERIRIVGDPYFVYLVGSWGRAVVIMLVVSATLAAFVHRARQLVAREARAERARANLARYFSANLVDALAGTDSPFGTTRRQDCAVLFADVVGFTTLVERAPPEAAIAFLRDFHARMEQAVFAHGGTLDKYIGDGVMATFGTPARGASDASNALRCAHDMVESVTRWNVERRRDGAAPIGIGVGLHFGPVVLGDVGGPQRLEFAVIGDTVNVASRLERLSRTLDTTLVASEALVAAARREPGAPADLLAGLRPAPEQAVRGRAAEVAVWYLPRPRASLT